MRRLKLAVGIGSVVLAVGLGYGLYSAWQVQRSADQDEDSAVEAADFNLEGPFNQEQLAALRGRVVEAKDCTLSGPYSHDNLTVFLIHGPDTLPGKNFLTLQEALEQKLVVVHETGDVSRLTIDNRSANDDVYIQSGDIVKGGQQDRVIQYDLIVSPGSGTVPLASFCVEQGRWARRGSESVRVFDSSKDQLAGQKAKLAAKYRKSQSAVWFEVSSSQSSLSTNLQGSVRSPASESSYQLTLEDSKVHEAAAKYLDKLAPILTDKKDVIGYAFVVNGKINSADVYASGALFKKLWPKLLKASAVEAVAELNTGTQAAEPVTSGAIKAFLIDSEKGKAYKQPVAGRIHVILQETDKNILFDTCDAGQENLVIHRSFLVKSAP